MNPLFTQEDLLKLISLLDEENNKLNCRVYEAECRITRIENYFKEFNREVENNEDI